MPRFGLLLFVLAAAAVAATESLFDLTTAEPHVSPGPGRLPATAKWYRQDDGSVVFQVTGEPTVRAGWRFPVSGPPRTVYTVSFEVEGENLDAAAGSANLYVELQPDGRQVPLFRAMGPRDGGLETITVDATGPGVRPVGIGIEVLPRAGGTATLTIRRLRITYAGNEPAADSETPPPGGAKLVPTPAGIRIRQGDTTLLPLGVWGDGLADVPVGSAPLRIVHVDVGAELRPWRGYVATEMLAERLAAAGPGAILLAVDVAKPPPWWRDEPAAAAPVLDPPVYTAAAEGLRLLIAALGRTPGAERIVGITILIGPEWNAVPPLDREARDGYRPAFRTWLNGAYPDLRQLRLAWHDVDLTRETAEPVPPARWGDGDNDCIRHPLANLPGRDSQRFYYESWTASLLHFAELARELTHGRWLIGITDGPAALLTDLWNNRPQAHGDCLRRILASPAVDFVCLEAVDGVGEYQLANALERRGKLLVVRVPPTLAAGTDLRGHLAAALNRRAHLLVPAAGAADVLRDWALVHLRAETLPAPTHPAVAVVIDPDTPGLLLPDPTLPWLSDTALRHTQRPRRRASPDPSRAWFLQGLPPRRWARLGAPFDVVLVDDLDPAAYRACIFVNVLRQDDRLRALAAACRGPGRVVGWTWAAGMISDRELSIAAAGKLVGMNLELEPGPRTFFLEPRPALTPFIGTDAIADFFGAQQPAAAPRRALTVTFAPIPVVVDAAATTLATFPDGGGTAMAIRRGDRGTVFYSAAPDLNGEITRALVREIGVQPLLAGPTTAWVDDHFLAFFSRGGRQVIELPEPGPLYEVLRDQELPAKSRHFVELSAGQWYLFFRGSRAAWQPAAVD